ncbi:hypothetical protein R6Z07F_006295 [Ovis aries]
MQPDPQETRRLSPEPVTGNRGRLGAAAAPRRQRDARSPKWARMRFRAPFGEVDGRPVVPLRGEDARSRGPAARRSRAGQRHRPAPPAQAADLQPDSPATAGSSRVSWRCHPRPLELCPGLGGRAAAFAGVASVPREGTGSRRPLGGSRRAAHTAPGAPRPPGRPDAPLIPGVPGPAGRGDPDNRREGGSWGDLPGQLREKARSSAIPERRTQAAQGQVPAPGRTWEFSEA